LFAAHCEIYYFKIKETASLQLMHAFVFYVPYF